MADAPSSYTTNYNIKKWIDGLHPGAVGFNANWDLIDELIHDVASIASGASLDTDKWSGTAIGLDAAQGRASLGLTNIGNIGSGAVSTTEFNYLAGVTSSIQTQFNALSAISHTHSNITYLNSINQNMGTGNSVTFAGLALNGTFTINNSTLVSNLNADLWDGNQFSDYLNQAVKTNSSPAFRNLTLGDASNDSFLTSHGVGASSNAKKKAVYLPDYDASGASALIVGNWINSAMWGIGGITGYLKFGVCGSDGIFTGDANVQAGVYKSTVLGGTAPFIVSSNTLVTNLNSDLWDGKQFSDYLDQAVKTTSDTVFNTIETTDYIQARGNIYGRGNLRFINKAGSSFISFAERNVSGIEVVYDLLNVGSATLSGNLTVNGTGNNYFAGKVGFGTTADATAILNINGNTRQIGDIYSDNWNGVDPYTGYYIGKTGSVFSKITANELHVKAFIADLEMALAGSQIISKSVAKIYSDFTVGGYLVVEDIPGYIGRVFANGDYIRLRTLSRTDTNSDGNSKLDVTDIWGTVTFVSRNDTTKTQTYSFAYLSGDGTTAKAGTLALDYGQSGNGIYETVAVGPLGKTPYSQIATWTTAPYTDLKPITRIGDFSGVTDAVLGSLTGFGVYTQRLYLSSMGASSNAITMVADNNTARLTMQMGGKAIFDFNTSTSTALMAGWTLNEGSFSKTSGFSTMEINANPYVYAGYGLSKFDDDSFVLMGLIPSTVGAYNGEVGILARDTKGTPVDYFVLTNNTKKIASFTFDTEKFTNIGNTFVISNNGNGKFALGASASTQTTSDTLAGSVIDGYGYFKTYMNSSNYIRANASGIDIKAGTFTLASSNVSIGQTSGWFGANNILTYSASSVGLANWTVDDSSISATGMILTGGTTPSIQIYSDDSNYVNLFYGSGFGIEGVYGGATVFRLGDVNQIAGFTFDNLKLTKGTSSVGMAINTGSTAFLTATGKGFEVWDNASPKLVAGIKNGSRMDWNFTSANRLTIVGDISGSNIAGSIISGSTIYTGSSSGYGNIAIWTDNAGLDTGQGYIRFNGSKQTVSGTDFMPQFSLYPSGRGMIMSMANNNSFTDDVDFLKLQWYTTEVLKLNSKGSVFITGKSAMRYWGTLSSAPSSGMFHGDTYRLSSTGKLWVYDTNAWVLCS